MGSVPAQAAIVSRAHASILPSFPKRGPLSLLVMAATALLALSYVVARELIGAPAEGRQARRPIEPEVPTRRAPVRSPVAPAAQARPPRPTMPPARPAKPKVEPAVAQAHSFRRRRWLSLPVGPSSWRKPSPRPRRRSSLFSQRRRRSDSRSCSCSRGKAPAAPAAPAWIAASSQAAPSQWSEGQGRKRCPDGGRRTSRPAAPGPSAGQAEAKKEETAPSPDFSLACAAPFRAAMRPRNKPKRQRHPPSSRLTRRSRPSGRTISAIT